MSQPDARLFAYERLDVWQDARKLIGDIYQITEQFPTAEKYGITSQLNRAAVSVACNLAEGSARISPKDQAHFSQLAYSSLMEVSCLLTISKDLRLLASTDLPSLREKIHHLSSRINKLRQSQLSRDS